MRRLGKHALFVGHAGDLRDVRSLHEASITAVVDLADSEPPAVLPREMISCRVPLADGDGNPTWSIEFAIRTVTQLLRADVTTLVACSAGLSRSVCVATAGLAVTTDHDFESLLVSLTAGNPADVSPALFAHVREMVGRC